MEPNNKPSAGNLQPGPAANNLNDYFGHQVFDEKEALK